MLLHLRVLTHAPIEPLCYLQRFLQGHGEVQLSALGVAISSMVTLAEILKNKQLAVETRIVTSLEEISSDSRSASAPPYADSRLPCRCRRRISASMTAFSVAAISWHVSPHCPSGQVYFQKVKQESVALNQERLQLQLDIEVVHFHRTRHKPKMSVTLVKSPHFDDIVAAENAGREGREGGATGSAAEDSGSMGNTNGLRGPRHYVGGGGPGSRCAPMQTGQGRLGSCMVCRAHHTYIIVSIAIRVLHH